MEQDRASDVLPHHTNLAGSPAADLGDGGQPDRLHHDGNRTQHHREPADYPKGVKPTEEEMAGLRLERDAFHGEWNYTLLP